MTQAAMPAFHALILAAGGGTRIRSSLPKVMHKLAHQPLVSHVLDCVAPLSPKQATIVLAPHMDAVKAHVQTHALKPQVAIQPEAKGTGHAVLCAMDEIKKHDGVVLVLYGDTPLIQSSTLEALLHKHTSEKATISLLGMQPNPPTGYGRLVMDQSGHVERIVECKDANEEEKKITWVWSGVMAVDSRFLQENLPTLKPSPVTNEYYLTALIDMAHQQKRKTVMQPIDVKEAMGINTRAQLAEAEAAMQERLRKKAMDEGATLIAPETVFLCADTKLGKDVIIHPHVVFGPGVEVADGVEIKSFSHIEGAKVDAKAIIGPYARLRPGTHICEEGHVGNFVELKKTTLGKGAKANHLSYLGDSTVGAGANVGAGTITCNYDGINKYETEIGAGAFIGSNSSLVAPVKIGEGALVGAGSVITQDVPADSMALARGRQTNLDARAKELRDKKK